MIELRDAVGLAAAAAAGILAIVSFAFLSPRKDRRARPGAALACVLLAALLLRAFAAADPDLHEWDESYHALVAKHLAEHPLTPTLYDDPVLPFDANAWTRNSVWLHKQPLALWTMAASIKAFGAHVWAVRLPSVLLSTAAVALTWGIGRAIGGARVAHGAALLHAVNGMAIALAAGRVPTDHVDTLFAVLVEASIFLAVMGRRRPGMLVAFAFGALVGLAALAKSLVSLFAIPLFAWLRGERGRAAVLRDAALAAIVALAVFAPWQMHAARHWPAESAHERAYDLLHLTHALEGHGGGPLYHLARLPRTFGELAPLSLAWFAWRWWTRRGRSPNAPGDRRLESLVALWIALPYAFFACVATKMPAYVFIAAPAVFVVIALHVDSLLSLARTRRGPTRSLALAAAALLLLLPARAGLERMKPLGSARWPSAEVGALREAARAHAGIPIAAFNVEDPIRTMFHTPFVAYDGLPDARAIEICRERGRRVLVWNDGRVPESIRADPGILLWPER
jgi:4-amino-4-deoxy-L-arabinose transferase